MNIYVGNLNYKVDEDAIKEAFSAFGEVTSAKIIMDKFSGKSKGFGFVEMANDTEGQQAIDELNQTDFQGRKMVVNEARPRE